MRLGTILYLLVWACVGAIAGPAGLQRFNHGVWCVLVLPVLPGGLICAQVALAGVPWPEWILLASASGYALVGWLVWLVLPAQNRARYDTRPP